MLAVRRRAGILLLGAALLASAGCSFGPAAIRLNTLRFNESVALTDKEQFLLNLVRLRYNDRPKVLGISNINTAFTFNGLAPGNGRVNKGWGDPFQASATDRPTITYLPLGGADFTLGVLKPVPLEQIALLVNTGWDLDRVLRLLVHTMNGLENVPHTNGQGEERTSPFAAFLYVARQLGELQQRGLGEIATEMVPKPISQPLDGKQLSPSDLVKAAEHHYEFQPALPAGSVVLTEKRPVQVLRVAASAWNVPEMIEAARLLRLVPGLPSYLLVPADEGQIKAAGPGPRTGLLVSTRSVLGASYFLSRGIEIPPEHYECGLVAAPVDENGMPFDWTEVTAGLFRMRVQKKKPSCAFIAVKHCGYWFYVPNDDRSSKATLVLMMELYDLRIVPHGQTAPVLTLPVTGSGG